MSRLRQLTADPKTLEADAMIAKAREALAAGRRHEARRCLWNALTADRESVQAWLMLAALASPRASLSYVTHALDLRPHNPVAHRALEWAQGRLEEGTRLKTQDSRGKAETAAETLLHAPDLEATVADVELPEPKAEPGPPPEAAAVTLLHAPPVEEAEKQPPPEATAAETLLHAPDLEATVAEVELPEQKAKPGPPPEAAAETLLHAPDLEATVAEVDLPLQYEEDAPGGGAATDGDDKLEGTAPHRAVSEDDDEELSSTAPHKAAGHAARALIAIVVITLIGLAAVAWGDWLSQPRRPAAIAAGPVEHYQKSTDSPLPTDTPTVTPSPTITPTFTPTPTVTPTPPASPTPAPFEAWAGGGQARWIDINLSLQMLTAMEGQSPVQTFVVSTGLWGTPTVTGDYQIYVKYPAADMSGPGYYLPQVPYVMYFHKGYGIHGTYWHNNFGNPMSHGCVNMRTDQAGWLFDWASVGTLVHVHY